MGKDTGAGTLGFASEERLREFLGVIPGAVTPFALINDSEQQVNIIIDQRLMDFEQINFHPLVNTATISVSPADLLKFIRACGHEPVVALLAGTTPAS
jgi:Ala-tRNA(Pro) deacylase